MPKNSVFLFADYNSPADQCGSQTWPVAVQQVPTWKGGSQPFIQKIPVETAGRLAGRAERKAVSAYILKMVLQRIMNKEYPLRRKNYGYEFRLVVWDGFGLLKVRIGSPGHWLGKVEQNQVTIADNNTMEYDVITAELK